jgi:hypothetical protein
VWSVSSPCGGSVHPFTVPLVSSWRSNRPVTLVARPDLFIGDAGMGRAPRSVGSLECELIRAHVSTHTATTTSVEVKVR